MNIEDLENTTNKINILKSSLEKLDSKDYFKETSQEEETEKTVSEDVKKLSVSETTIGQDYSEHSQFIRNCMRIAGIAVIVFIVAQYFSLVWLIYKFIQGANKNTTIILTSFIASTFGETIIIAKIMANSVFQNDHQNQLAKYKSTKYAEKKIH